MQNVDDEIQEDANIEGPSSPVQSQASSSNSPKPNNDYDSDEVQREVVEGGSDDSDIEDTQPIVKKRRILDSDDEGMAEDPSSPIAEDVDKEESKQDEDEEQEPFKAIADLEEEQKNDDEKINSEDSDAEAEKNKTIDDVTGSPKAEEGASGSQPVDPAAALPELSSDEEDDDAPKRKMP